MIFERPFRLKKYVTLGNCKIDFFPLLEDKNHLPQRH